MVGGIGDQLRQDYTAIGDTTNLAARLQEIAEPGTILVSEATMRFLHGTVEVEALEPVHVKGKEALIQVYRALSGPDVPHSSADDPEREAGAAW